jgi:outer membrane protein TolC
VLDGGNLAAQAEAASHRQAQALANFQSTVLNAFEEVENALNGVYLMRQNLASLRPALEAAQKTKALAQDLYRQGIFSEVKLLDAEENLIVIEDAVLNSETSLQTQWILLARATAVEQTSEPVSSSSRSGH